MDQDQSNHNKKPQEATVPPVPIKTYQWEDVKRARQQGGYPWTHLDKEPLQGEDITAETVLRDSTPCRSVRSMSREPSRERSGGRSPGPIMEDGSIRILMLDASPGSSRKLGEGEEDVAHVPNFSKEISLDTEEDLLGKPTPTGTSRSATPDLPPKEPRITLSPKGILKRKHPPKPKVPAEDSPRNSKCCHPFVEKIKLIADKTLHKTEKILPKKDASQKKKTCHLSDEQEIILLECSPGTERRERQKLAELGDNESPSPTEVKISLVMKPGEVGPVVSENSPEIYDLDSSPSSRRRKEHIYEDIDKNDPINDNFCEKEIGESNDIILQDKEMPGIISNNVVTEPPPAFMDTEPQSCVPMDAEAPSSVALDSEPPLTTDVNMDSERTNLNVETKSGDSNDPSLLIDDPMDDDESTSESITKIKAMYDVSMTPDKLVRDISNEAIVLEAEELSDIEKASDEEKPRSSPNITITEVTDDVLDDQHLKLDTRDENVSALDRRVHFDMSESTSDPIPVEETPPDDGKENVWSKMSDHEYEPIGKPAKIDEGAARGEASGGDMAGGSGEDSRWVGEVDDASSTTSQERQFLRAEEDNEAFSASATDGEPDAENDAMLLQKEIEDRFFVNTPTTTESRTDCEISTSQVDSSALEDLPLKRENRKKSAVALETSKLKQKIKNQTGKISTQAGKLKTKLKTIKKPQFHMPERPKFERPKFNMPERPKFNLPERPKFNFPDRPKINFPDKSKFRLPDRPKINLPDRPKFNFPDRPKFSMPDRSKFKLPDRPKLNFSTFSRNKDSNRKTKANDENENSTESTSGSNKKPMISFDFRTYPRLFGKNKKDKRNVKERPGTPPPGFATVPRMTRDRQQVMASQWDHASSKTDDEPRQYGAPLDYSYEPDFETKLAQVDKDYRQMQEENIEGEDTIPHAKISHKTPRAVIDNQELWNKLERSAVKKLEHGSSLPHILPGQEENGAYDESRVTEDDESSAASTGQHRRGVLEEIDNDEFFLRQKGISQDNIEVGKYLSDEIRDAFRSPVNALSQMDTGNRYNRDEYVDDRNMDSRENIEFYKYKDDDDNDEHLGYGADLNTNEAMTENDDGYYTFPPVRPSRAKKLKALAQESEITSYDATHVENIVQLQNVNLEEIPTPEIFTDPVAKSFDSDNHIENIRKHVFTSSFKEPEMLENLNEYENEMEQTRDVPMIPKRRKRSKKDFNYSENGSINNEMFDRDDWNETISNEEKNISNEIIVHRIEHIIPYSTENEDPPALPQRRRSRSRGGSSICDDDRTSRGAESIILDSHTQLAPVDLDFMDDLDDGPGYAVVDKNAQNKKVDPPPRPPAPMRRQRSAKSLSGERQYFTVPRALKASPPPRRPLRNYSTLGPSRPPRKKSTSSLTTSEVDFRHHDSSTDVTQYVEIEDEDQETQKDLKSGDVISKMKDRPLPPPPRPPRGPKKKRDKEDSFDKKDDDDDVLIQSSDADQPHDFLRSQDIINSPAIDQTLNTIHSQDMVDSQKFIESEGFEERVPQGEGNETDFLNYSDPVTNKNSDSGTVIENDLIIDESGERGNLDSCDQEEVIEIEVSTQTDPLPDDFDYDLGMDEPLNEHFDYIPDAVADFMKEEQEENSIDVEIFSRGIQKFRESSRPNSRASKTRTPIDSPRTPLGRMSPTAILIERRVSSPTRINERDVIVTEASLTVQPVDEPLAEPEPTAFVPLNRMYPSVDSPPYTKNWITHLSQTAPPTIEAIPPGEENMSTQQHLCLSDENILMGTEPRSLLPNENGEMDILRTRRLQVSDLDVERLNVAELQAGKILVSEIEGLSLQVADLNSKSGHIFVRGIELAPGVIEEILQKFSQMVPPSAPTAHATPEASVSTSTSAASATSTPAEAHHQKVIEQPRPETNQETQTEVDQQLSDQPSNKEDVSQINVQERISAATASDPVLAEPLPERPPLPHIHPLASSIYPLAYYPEYSIPPGSFYRLRNPSERHPEEASEPDLPPGHNRRRKHKREPAASSSDEEYRPVNRRAPPSRSTGEPSVSDLSLQLFRACQNSVSRSVRHILSYISSHFGGGEDKKDVQMALVIFLVMIAGLIMLGVGDGRTVHHHHWDFFNPPNNDK